jgi:hypothetical protein
VRPLLEPLKHRVLGKRFSDLCIDPGRKLVVFRLIRDAAHLLVELLPLLGLRVRLRRDQRPACLVRADQLLEVQGLGGHRLGVRVRALVRLDPRLDRRILEVAVPRRRVLGPRLPAFRPRRAPGRPLSGLRGSACPLPTTRRTHSRRRRTHRPVPCRPSPSPASVANSYGSPLFVVPVKFPALFAALGPVP